MSDNPLKPYFRVPTIYFKLPSEGKYYAPGVVNIPPNGELPVYPMTTRDEMSIRIPDGLYNGSSVVEVIKNCIPGILDPWKLNSVDLDAVIIAIRAASFDGELEITSVCPACNEEGKYGVDLLVLLAEKANVDYHAPLKMGDLEIYFRPLTYQEINQNSLEQFDIQRLLVQLDDVEDTERKKTMVNDGVKKLNELSNKILCQSIRHIKTPETIVTDRNFIQEFVDECDSKTGKAILDHSAELKKRNENRPLKMTCVNCSHKYDQPLVLNFTDFFV